MRPFMGDFPFFMEQATYALNCFQIHVVKLCTSITLSEEGRKPHPNWASYVKDVLLNLAPTYGQLIGPPPKQSKCQPNKNPTCLLGVRCF